MEFLAWVWANWALGQAELLFEVLNQAHLHPAKFPGQSVT